MTLIHQVKPHNSSDHLEVGLEITSTVLRTLEKVSKASPIPGLSEAAGIALNISETIQKIKGNTSAFNRLGADACELVYVIYRTMEQAPRAGDVSIDPELEGNLDGVLKVLLSIQEFADRGASRKKTTAFWRADVDAEHIREYRERLQQCMCKFGFESGISIRFMVFKLTAQHEKIIGILEDKENLTSREEKGGGVGHAERKAGRLPISAGGATGEATLDASQMHNISLGNHVDFSGASGVCIGFNNMAHSNTKPIAE